MNNNVLIAIVVVIVVLGAGTLIYRGNSPMTPQEAVNSSGAVSPTEPSMPTPPPSGQVMEDGVISATTTGTVTATPAVKEFTVTGKSFSFAPTTITVKKGDRVKITFKNAGGMHDWQLPEFKAATKKLNSGEQETIEFVADKAGSFEYYCSVGNHRAMGMKGTLVVQ